MILATALDSTVHYCPDAKIKSVRPSRSCCKEGQKKFLPDRNETYSRCHPGCVIPTNPRLSGVAMLRRIRSRGAAVCSGVWRQSAQRSILWFGVLRLRCFGSDLSVTVRMKPSVEHYAGEESRQVDSVHIRRLSPVRTKSDCSFSNADGAPFRQPGIGTCIDKSERASAVGALGRHGRLVRAHVCAPFESGNRAGRGRRARGGYRDAHPYEQAARAGNGSRAQDHPAPLCSILNRDAPPRC